MKFNLVLRRTKWWQCLEDITDCLGQALERAGHEVNRRDGFYEDHGMGPTLMPIEIAIGAHRESVQLPSYPVIIYQTEVPGSRAFPASYAEKLKRAICVWDSAPGYGTGQAVVEPGLYDTKAADVPKDIDLLFYGSLSDRRVELLTKLHDAGLNPQVHFNVFGKERDALVDRAKVVVDIKQRQDDPDDKTRTFWLDSRGACVLTENDSRPGRLEPASIVQQCKALLVNPQFRDMHMLDRRSRLKPMDVTAGISALESAVAFRVDQKVFHHPV